MIFSTLTHVAHYIRRHHCIFADQFCSQGRIANDGVLDELGKMNAHMMQEPAMNGATFEAWQCVPQYGKLKTHITVEKSECGWMVKESTL